MINSFTGKHRFLSNFYPCVITMGNAKYPSAEHAYMSFKNNSPQWIAKCQDSSITPVQIKQLSRHIDLIEGWDTIRLQVMLDVLDAKFGQNPDLAAQLIATGDEELIEGNTWGDTFWGVRNNVGENHLGELLMRIRTRLKSNE
jgi:N-glycosidase YbiA